MQDNVNPFKANHKSKKMIKPLTIKDYPAMVTLWEKAGLPYKPKGRDSKKAIQKQMAENPDLFLGAFLNNELIGCIIATFDGRKGWINRVAVLPEYQRQGIGVQLVKAAEKVLKERGAHVIGVLIFDTNKLSLTLFQKVGYYISKDILYLSKRESDKS